MNLFFRITSIIFHPLLMPAYGLSLAFLCTPLRFLSAGNILSVTAVVLLLTAVLPFLLLCALWRVGIITDIKLDDQRQRTLPYMLEAVFYVGVLVYFYRASAPDWLTGFVVGALVSVVVVSAVNLKWKISAHATGAGGLMGFAAALTLGGISFVSMMWPTIWVILIAGLVCTSRLGLQRHTPWQIVAGLGVGYFSELIFTLLI